MTSSHHGLFVDLDGTLADSISVMRSVYDRFLVGFGKRGSDAEFSRLNGPPLTEILVDLARTHDLSQPLPSLLSTYQTLIEAAYRNVAPNSGASDLLQSARDHGLRVGVVTSNASSLTRAWLQRVNLDLNVDVIVGGDDVSAGKPDPEPYRLALQRSGCTAAASFAVEDSTTGARAAIDAGIRTFFLSATPDAICDGATTVTCLQDVEKNLAGDR